MIERLGALAHDWGVPVYIAQRWWHAVVAWPALTFVAYKLRQRAIETLNGADGTHDVIVNGLTWLAWLGVAHTVYSVTLLVWFQALTPPIWLWSFGWLLVPMTVAITMFHASVFGDGRPRLLRWLTALAIVVVVCAAAMMAAGVYCFCLPPFAVPPAP